MKLLDRIVLLSSAALMIGCSDSYELQLSIPRWKDNNKGAVALTFDDWTPGHPAIVVPELKKRGMVATFNVITGSVSDWEPLRQAVALGHEVANHSVTHPHPNGISFENEVLAAKQKIEAEIPQQKVLTYAYPYGEFTDSLRLYLMENGYFAARGVKTPVAESDFANNDSVDYFDTKAYSVMTETSIDDFAAQLTNVEKGGGMLTYLYHSVYNDSVKDFSYAWVLDSKFRQQLDTLMEFDLWVTTYADMIRYHRQHASAKIETVKNTPDKYVFRLKTDNVTESEVSMTIMLTSTLNGQFYIESEKQIKVMQNGKRLSVMPFVSHEKDSEGKRHTIVSYDKYLFDVMPNDGDISIEYIKPN